jgi:hypothetical protein
MLNEARPTLLKEGSLKVFGHCSVETPDGKCFVDTIGVLQKFEISATNRLGTKHPFTFD